MNGQIATGGPDQRTDRAAPAQAAQSWTGPGDPPQRTFSEQAAAAALLSLTTRGPYLPWGAGTMRVAGLVAVCNDVVLSARRCLLELGSGTSTVVLARLLHEHWPGGEHRQVAVEHDRAWADWVRDQLRREGLADRTTVLHVPLAPHRHGQAGLPWYDHDQLHAGLDDALYDDAVDLLLVDGPPADTADKVLARYPALPALHERLAPGATVVLDDAERPGEQEVLRRWEREFDICFERRAEVAGVALGRLGGAGPAAPVHG
jgi:predicted O-methyltransferase YrrM